MKIKDNAINKIIDSFLGNISKDGLYYYNASALKYFSVFALFVVQNAIEKNTRVLWITQNSIKDLIFIAKTYGVNLETYLDLELLILLEYPPELKKIINEPNNTSYMIKDLQTYIDAHNPKIVIFDTVDSLLSTETGTENLNSLSLIESFLLDIKGVLLLGTNNKKILFGEKLQKKSTGSFDIKIENKIENSYSLIFHSNRNNRKKTRILHFKYVFGVGIVTINDFPQQKTIPLRHFQNFFIPKYYPQLQTIISKSVEQHLDFYKYENFDDLQNLIKDDPFALIFITDTQEHISGLEACRRIRIKNKQIKIVMIISQSVPISQRVRMKRLGVNAILYIPIVEKSVKRALEMLNPVNKIKSEKDSVKILYVKERNSSIYSHQQISYKSIKGYLKNYADKILKKRNCFILASFKLKYVSVEELSKKLQENCEYIFSIVKDNAIIIVLIIENNKKKKEIKKFIENAMKFSFDFVNVNNKFGIDLQEIELNKFDIKMCNYPFDNVDIDHILSNFL